MTDRTDGLLRLAAIQLATIVGMLHVFLALHTWRPYLDGGVFLPPDIRLPLWLLSGVGLLVGTGIVILGEITDRRVYAGGVALSVTYILGYYSWHLGGHRSFFLAGEPALHDSGPIEFVVSHTFAGPVEFFALLTEVALLVVLIALIQRAGPEA